MAWFLGFWGTSQRTQYLALLDDAAGIVNNNAVKIAGVEVGRVEAVGVQGQQARLLLRIDKQLPLYKNSQVSVRAKSLLGEKYIQLNPGSQEAGALEPGGRIRQGHATFEVDQLLNSLRTVMGDEEPLTQRLASILRRADHLMAKLEEPEVEEAMRADLERVRRLVDESAAVAQSLHLVLDGQEEHLQKKMRVAANWMGDPRWGRIVGRLDRLTASLDEELPTLLASTRASVVASQSLLQRADAHLDDRSMKALADSLQNLSEISRRTALLSKDLTRLQRKLKQGPLKAEELGQTLHALHKISKRAAKVDQPMIRRFLQKEGLKIYLGGSRDARRELKAIGAR